MYGKKNNHNHNQNGPIKRNEQQNYEAVQPGV